MKDRNRFSVANVLKESYVNEGIISIDVFKKFNKEKHDKLASFLANMSMKTTIGIAGKTKFVKQIIATQGKVDRFQPYKDSLEILKFANRIVDNDVPADFRMVVKDLNTLNFILTNQKDVIQFKKGIQENNASVSMLYAAVVSQFCQSASLLFSTYFTIVEDKGVTIIKEDKELRNNKTIKELNQMVDLYNNGYFLKVYKVTPTSESITAVYTATILLLSLILLTRVIVFKVYEMRSSLAENLRESADILIENTVSVSSQAIRDKQTAAAERFRRLANKIDIADSLAQNSSEKVINKLDSKIMNEFNRSESEESVTGMNFGF